MSKSLSKSSGAKGTYTGIDFVKFFMALCVVMIHVRALYVGFDPGATINFIISLAVPFFFTASGFLLAHKMKRTEDPRLKDASVLNYSKRIWRMYFLWILIYVPLCLLGEYLRPSETSMLKFALVQVRSALMLGEIRFSYPTWYLYSLGAATLLIYFFRKKHLNLWLLFVVGIVGILLQFLVQHIEISHTIQAVIWCLSRWSIGIGYVLCGMFLYNNRRYACNGSWIMLMAVAIILFMTGLPFSETLGSVALFIISLMIMQGLKSSLSIWFRRQSLWIYLSHMYVLTPLCLFGVISNPWVTFFVGSAICIVLSQILISLSQSRYGQFLNKLV